MSVEILQRLRDPRSTPLRVHLIGVAGSGMSGLASLLMGIGHQVSGSDKVRTVETDRLLGAGLRFFSPQGPGEIEGADLVIYSSAIKPGNVAYDAAREMGVAMVRRAEALAAIMQQKRGIIVAGTHGKTTTSSMASHVLRSGGLKPSHYVGAEIPLLGTNAHWEPGSEYIVAEGDESDGTLALFHPEHAIILNIEPEHLDFYRDLDEIKAVFEQLIRQTAGFFIYCGDDPGSHSVGVPHERAISYGWNRSCAYAAVKIRERRGTSSYHVLRRGEDLGEIELGIPGRHNVLNSLAVVALATELGVGFPVVRAAMGTFRGAKRRFEAKYRSGQCLVYDDYGHHPTEVQATLATARSLEPKRVLCVFQPHRYSRTQLLRNEFGRAFDDVDHLLVTDVYAASEPPIPGVSGETICEAVREFGKAEVQSTPRKDQARFLLGNLIRRGDLVISLGAGDVHEVTAAISADLEVLDRLRAVLDEEEAVLRLYEPMSRHTTIRIGGPARYWIEPSTIAGFARLVSGCREMGLAMRVVGRGSNLLIRDGGIDGVVVHPSGGDFDRVDVRQNWIEAGAGARFKKLASAAQKAGIAGFEWMEGIPGNVGGGIRMNAGAMGTETFDQVVSVTFVDAEGQLRTKLAEEIAHDYRNVPEFAGNYVVSAVFKGHPGTDEGIRSLMETSKRKRKESQPTAASAGCIFKNPEICGAGKLVDELGLKNTAVGRARVSEVHGNFIVNDGGATAAEALQLISVIQEKARAERGVELETEVQILGEESPMI